MDTDVAARLLSYTFQFGFDLIAPLIRSGKIRKKTLALAYLAPFEPMKISPALDNRIVQISSGIYKVKNSNLIRKYQSGH
ncbi:MAG: hypothetical protein ACJAUY_001941 [Cognaticolwellia sp.]|jgi:hypothetical protein